MYQDTKKRKRKLDSPAWERKERFARRLHGELCTSAGLPARSRGRDPVFSISEAFTARFRLEGRRLAGRDPAAEGPFPEAPGMPYRPSEGQEQAGPRLRRFADAAFSRGTLAAGILQGGGRLMLVSCLRRTLGQPEPNNAKQTTLSGASSVHRNLPGGQGQVIYNRDKVNSAVGLVVGSLRSAGRVLETMTEAAEGRQSPLRREGGKTLPRIYPFLFIEEDRRTLKAYRERLRALEQAGDEDCADVLRRGVVKLEALIQRKEAQRIRFISVLGGIRDNAEQAERLFSAPGLADELTGELRMAAAPPEDGGHPGEEPPKWPVGQDADLTEEKEDAGERPDPSDRESGN